MRVTFFGHADFFEEERYEEILLNLLEEKCNGKEVSFYLGENGTFDRFAYTCAKKYKSKHPTAKLIFVTPYIEQAYLSARAPSYDETVFPNIESTPYPYRIPKRNEYMVKSADLIITYVKRETGGAYKTLKFAKKENKPVINLVTDIKNPH